MFRKTIRDLNLAITFLRLHVLPGIELIHDVTCIMCLFVHTYIACYIEVFSS